MKLKSILFFIVFLQKEPLLSALTPISKAHFTFLLQQLQHEGPSGRSSRGRNFPEDCGKEGGVCGHYEQVDDDIYIMMQFCLFVMKKPFWESRVITCNHP